MYASEYAICQDNLSPHILAGIVGLVRSVADIDQSGLHVGRVTVVSQSNRIGRPVSQKQMLWPDLPQLAGLDRPSQVRPHQPVLNFSVDGELLALYVRQSVFLCPLLNELGCLIKFGGGRHAMEAGQVT